HFGPATEWQESSLHRLTPSDSVECGAPMARNREDWPGRVDGWREMAVLTLILAGALALPLVFVRDPFDMFRLSKALFLRGEAILLAGVTLIAYLLGAPLPRLKWRDPWLLLPLALLAGLTVLTMTSTNVPLSIDSLGSAVAA